MQQFTDSLSGYDLPTRVSVCLSLFNAGVIEEHEVRSFLGIENVPLVVKLTKKGQKKLEKTLAKAAVKVAKKQSYCCCDEECCSESID